MHTFADLSLLPAIQASLKALDIITPTEIQEKVIPLLLKNPQTDIHAQAQTGTGKTLAFGIPLLQAIDPSIKSVQSLIVAPTRELVLQTYESLKEVARQTPIRLEPVYGGMPITQQIINIRRGAQIIIGTPGRLNDHLRRKTLSLSNLKILVLDEADIMLDMGFRQEIDEIFKFAPRNRQIWLFSATVMSGIKQLIQSHMRDAVSIRATAQSVICSQVKQYFCVVPLKNRVIAAARFIEASPDFYGIIFCQTKIVTSKVTEQLASKGFKVNCLHGDMSQSLRNQVIKGFKNKDFNVLIATNVAARGLDISDLTHVINFAIPEEHESYIHRIGRTGRAGKEGIAIMFVAPDQMHRIRRLEKAAQTSLQEIQIPPIESIVATKMGAISNFIEQAKQPDKRLSPIHTSLKELINSFTEEEIKNSLAMALEDKFFKDIVHEKLEQATAHPFTMPQEICIDLGHNQGLSESSVRDYIYRTCKVLPQEVRKVRVLDRKTFISIPEDRLQACIQSMRTTPISTQRHNVFLVEDVYREKRGPSRPSHDRFERGGSFGSSKRPYSRDRKR